MGLDMYFYKKTYVKNWDFMGAKERHQIGVKLGDEFRKDIKPERITFITEEVGYWRKFNALHRWFIMNCADGIDVCQEIPVTIKKIKDVLDVLNEVKTILNKSGLAVKLVNDFNGESFENVYEREQEVRNILPPTQGFFFGGIEIDEWFKMSVEESIKIFTEVLKDEEISQSYGSFSEFYYRASW
jgi:hypothetical protein